MKKDMKAAWRKLVVFSVVSVALLPLEAVAASQVGVNLSRFNFWNTQTITANAILSGTDFFLGDAQNWDLGAVPDRRRDGYPARLATGKSATKLMNRNAQWRDGRYIFKCRGNGRVEFGFAGDVRVVSQDGPCNAELEISGHAGTGVYVRILETDPHNPIHAMELYYKPDYEAYHRDNPWIFFDLTFLQVLAQFTGPIRSLNLTQANVAPDIRRWSDRVPWDYNTWDVPRKSAPFEPMIHLANLLRRDLWAPIPCHAEDDFIRGLAELNATHLRGKAYVEHGNEDWNSAFAFNVCFQNAISVGRTVASRYNITRGFWNNALHDGDYNVLGSLYLDLNACKIFREVYTQRGRPQDVVCVRGSQAHGVMHTEHALWFLETYPQLGFLGKPDVVAIAPYVTGGLNSNLSEANSLSVNQIIDRLLADIPQEMGRVRQHVDVVNRYNAQWSTNMKVVVYETAVDLVADGPNTTIATKFQNVNLSPRMSDVYKQIALGIDQATGGTTMAFYSLATPFSGQAIYGICTNTNECNQSHKFRGIQQAIEILGR